MQIAFRTDANSQIGTGHFMRCLTLATALKTIGAEVRFVSRGLPAYLCEMLATKQIELAFLEPNEVPSNDDLTHSNWLGASQAQDAADTVQALADQFLDCLIIDHYAIDARWESVLRRSTKKIMVIDDIADRNHDCDVLLDQNYYADMQARYVGKVPLHCQMLLGPRYALLRDEFRTLRQKIKPHTGLVKNILVFFGGVDAGNYTEHAVKALAQFPKQNFTANIVIGLQHPNRVNIESLCAQYGYVCHVQTNNMAELMLDADLAIGAGGSATWERCSLGLPTLSICVASNQQKQIEDAAEQGLLYSPLATNDLEEVILRHTQALFENAPLLKLISNAGQEAVDGKGVMRVINTLRRIEIRVVTEEDSKNLFEWRNHPTVRSVSRNVELISWEEHQAWFKAVLANADRLLLIGYVEGKPVGVVRFDKEGNVAEVSIYLVPDSAFSGQGSNFLLSAEQWLRENHPEISHVSAHVLRENTRSQQLFLGLNYTLEKSYYQKAL